MKLIAMLFLSVLITLAFSAQHEPAAQIALPKGFVSYTFPLKNGLGSIEMLVPKNMSQFREETDLSTVRPMMHTSSISQTQPLVTIKLGAHLTLTSEKTFVS